MARDARLRVAGLFGHDETRQTKPDDPSAGRRQPLAISSEPRFDTRDWKGHFAATLVGKGLEIGPLHEPLPQSPGASVDHVDRLPLEDLRKHYPELPPEKIVTPDILDDAETLGRIADGTYDFVSASHVIEHMRNPIGALENWCRVLKPAGLLYLVVPDKRATFDRSREQTTLEHMVLDYRDPSRDRDREHFLEWSTKVDGKVGEHAVEAARHLEQMDYSIHFHVFLPSDVATLLTWFSANVQPLEVVEGPVMVPGSFEFHFMLRKGAAAVR